MTKLKVMRERCDECLYGPNKIVSNARRSQIIREVTRADSRFICHKASIAGQEIACRGDWDARMCGNLGRVMSRLNGIEFVDAPETAPDGGEGSK